MTNPYYDHTSYPANGAQLSSSALRSELEAVEAGFALLPTLSGNGSKIVAVNSGGTALEAITTTGTGSGVRATSPTLVTPVLGVATATSINGLTITASTGTLTVTNAKTLSVSNTLTLTGTDTSSVAFGAGGTVAYVANKLSVFAATSSAELASVISDETGSGLLVFGTSPTLTTPILGTPTSGTLTNCTGYSVANLASAGTGVVTALGVNVGSAGAVVVNGGALGTPSSGTLSSCSGLPISTGVSGLGSGVATFLATPTSANLAAAVTNETGSGLLVFDTSPSLTTPTLGVATATSINKVAITAPASSATLTIADGKTLTVSNSITFAGTDSTTMTFPGASASIGYLSPPQNSQNNDYTLVLTDAGKQIYLSSGSKTFTIPANASVAYPIGTQLFFTKAGSGTLSIAITSDTLTLANTTTTGTRSIAQNGMARAWKVTATTWVIDGTGLT